jgi:hypothetical protein
MIKTLGKDTVVIMTVKQGEDINKQFKALGDSIQTLKGQINILDKQLVTERNSLKANIVSLKEDVNTGQKKTEFFKTENERLKGLVWKDAKAAKRNSIAMITALAAWTIITSQIFK